VNCGCKMVAAIVGAGTVECQVTAFIRKIMGKAVKEMSDADEKAIALATRFGYSPNAYKSLGSALKALIDQTPSKRQRAKYEARLQALKRSASKAKQNPWRSM